MIEVSEVVLHERDEPDFVVDLLDADVLTGKDGAEVDLEPVEADTSAAGDGDGSVVERVVELVQASIRP